MMHSEIQHLSSRPKAFASVTIPPTGLAFGTYQVFAALVRAVNGSGLLLGKLSVGALEGDLLGGLRVRDIALCDGEGRVAVAALVMTVWW